METTKISIKNSQKLLRKDSKNVTTKNQLNTKEDSKKENERQKN